MSFSYSWKKLLTCNEYKLLETRKIFLILTYLKVYCISDNKPIFYFKYFVYYRLIFSYNCILVLMIKDIDQSMFYVFYLFSLLIPKYP